MDDYADHHRRSHGNPGVFSGTRRGVVGAGNDFRVPALLHVYGDGLQLGAVASDGDNHRRILRTDIVRDDCVNLHDARNQRGRFAGIGDGRGLAADGYRDIGYRFRQGQ
jgi:hypothetical protein